MSVRALVCMCVNAYMCVCVCVCVCLCVLGNCPSFPVELCSFETRSGRSSVLAVCPLEGGRGVGSERKGKGRR